jgi:hypothetical protein
VTNVTKARLIFLLLTAVMFAMLVAKLYRPIGVSDGGFW